VLIIGQVAFACVLLTGAGLLTQTFRALENEPLGFNPNNLLTVGLKLPGLKYHEPRDQAKFYQELLEKIEELPGVKSAAIDDDVPFSGFRAVENFAVTGQPERRHGEEPSAETHYVSPDYFRTMGIPILRGRSFGPDDVLGNPLVILIDKYLAQKFFPGRDPIGQQLNQQPAQADKPRVQYTIVGIVPSVRHGEVGIAPKIPQIYWPAAQFSSLQTTLLVRTEVAPSSLLPSVRAVVRSIDPQLPIFRTRTMEEAVAASISTQRLSATLMEGFSLIALFLAALGLYAVLAYSVTQRTREIGIRIALGSPRSRIFGLIVRQGIIMIALGILIGIALALGCGPLIQHLVYGVAPHDPKTIIGVSVLLLGVAILACWVPALRAIRVDPIVALRQE
jgi:putative ABC transport system permease protein